MVSSYFTPDAARGLAAGPQRHLNVHGDNLGNVVQFMQREHSDRFASILQRIADRIPGVKNIDTHVTEDKRVLLRFNNSGFRDPFFAQQMSDGTLKVFAYLLLLEHPDPPPFNRRAGERSLSQASGNAGARVSCPCYGTKKRAADIHHNSSAVFCRRTGAPGSLATRKRAGWIFDRPPRIGTRSGQENGCGGAAAGWPLVQRLPRFKVGMHIEILTEDSSGQRLLEHLMPNLSDRAVNPIRGVFILIVGSVAFRRTCRRYLTRPSAFCWTSFLAVTWLRHTPGLMPLLWCSTQMTVIAQALGIAVVGDFL